jgi:butyryl-CoA dehydrogenase
LLHNLNFLAKINPMKNFQNKIAVVTGAASGIGRSLALQFLAQGATVIGTDINAEQLAETKSLSNDSSNLHAYTFDIGQKQAIEDFSKDVLQKFGHIDILINNAGMSIGPYKLKDIAMESFEKIVAVNLWGVIYTSHYFMDALMSRPEAAIVNLSSVFGLFGLPAQAPYCTTKYAVRGYSEALRTELKDTGVAITTVHPGGIKTGIVSNGVFHSEEERKKVSKDFERIALSTPDFAAQKILEGIQKKSKRVFIGKDAHFIYFFSRFWPSALEWVAKRRLERLT